MIFQECKPHVYKPHFLRFHGEKSLETSNPVQKSTFIIIKTAKLMH